MRLTSSDKTMAEQLDLQARDLQSLFKIILVQLL